MHDANTSVQKQESRLNFLFKLSAAYTRFLQKKDSNRKTLQICWVRKKPR